ncbi:MAG TPA: hypothetical protein V6C97_13095 [Oculatellaceae cyanobacterium]
MHRNLLVLFLTVVGCGAMGGAGIAQSTVGNGTVFAPTLGESGPYGLNTPAAGATDTGFLTRHSRRVAETGIGNSFLQTTSPTSESSPAVEVVSPQAARTSQIRLPKLESAFGSNFSSPALDVFAPALPHIPQSAALSAPSTAQRDFGYQPQQLESLPSFSRRNSVMDQMNFGKLNFGEP